MSEEIYPKQFLKSLGPLFQEYRKESGFSIRDIARSANISHTVVFDIENKKIIPNPETLVDLFGTLGIPLYKDETTLWPLKDTLDAFFEAFYMKYYSELKLYYQSLLRGEDILLHSPLRIEFLFAKAIHTILVEEKNASITLKNIEWLWDCFTDQQKQALVLLKGMNAFSKKTYSLAFSHFIEGENHTASDNMNHLTYYYLAFTSDKLFKKELSLYYGRTASDKYSDANNFHRKLELDLLLVKNMLELGNIKTAEHYLQNIRYAITHTNGTVLHKQRMMNTKGYLHFIKGEYQEALEHLSQMDQENGTTHMLKVFIAYKQNRYDEIKKMLGWMAISDNKNVAEMYKQCAVIFLDFLGEPQETSHIDYAMDYVLTHPYELETKHARTFFTRLIISHYERLGQFEQALTIAKSCLDNEETL